MAAFSVRLMTLLALALLCAVPSAAQLAPAGKAISPALVAENATPAPGSDVMLAIVMRPSPGWHGYWQNPGDAGTSAQAEWRLPPGVKAGELRYPVPDRLLISGLMNYVYEKDYALLVPVRLPSGLGPGTRLPIGLKLDYLACTDKICVPQRAELSLDLTVGEPGRASGRDGRFDRWRQAMPQPLGSEARFALADGRVQVAIPVPAALHIDRPYFFPATRDFVNYAAEQEVRRSGDWLIVEVPAADDAKAPLNFEGVLRIGPDRGLAVNARPGAVPSVAQGGGGLLLATALLGAIAGGLLLNIMPCVFPILSLKALSLARAGGDEAEARREALAYAAGVILVCLALGGLLLGLRAGGTAIGWAFQLQDPRVILVLLLLMLAIALNLAGLFELPTLATGGRTSGTGGGPRGAFWTGALAAFVATPCTGPFMGAALGAALVLPWPAALAVFAGLGFGLALPFLLLGFLPILRRHLPRPGSWMVRFRHWMSVPMFLTAAGLAWILARQTGMNGLLLGLGVALITGAALFVVGRRQGSARSWPVLIPAAAASVAAVVLLPVIAAPAVASEAVAGAQPFSESRLAQLRGQGRQVFVYFTADWCVTCKVNEKAVLQRSEVAKAFAAHDVAVLVGDWTNGDPAISRFLEKQGRSGVPLYLYYPPGKEAEVLPQILSVGAVTALLN